MKPRINKEWRYPEEPPPENLRDLLRSPIPDSEALCLHKPEDNPVFGRETTNSVALHSITSPRMVETLESNTTK
jgi:hypothetical protein